MHEGWRRNRRAHNRVKHGYHVDGLKELHDIGFAGCDDLDFDIDKLTEEEIEEFLEEIKNISSKGKKEVIKRLKKIKQIFAFQVPTMDITKDGWNLQGTIINYLIPKTKGFEPIERVFILMVNWF